MKHDKVFISTIDENAHIIAGKHGLGIEIAEFCTAWNMDEKYETVEPKVSEKLRHAAGCTMHAPFNELFPCAIDQKARELAAFRYRQALTIASHFGAEKLVVHGGFNPYIYYPSWYVEQSVLFWKTFLETEPGIQIVLENVMEPEPELLFEIVSQVDSPELKLCLDIGHVNAYSKRNVFDWVERYAPKLSHLHIHNNSGEADTHSPLEQGTIPMPDLLKQVDNCCPDATFTLEIPNALSSVEWMIEENILI